MSAAAKACTGRIYLLVMVFTNRQMAEKAGVILGCAMDNRSRKSRSTRAILTESSLPWAVILTDPIKSVESFGRWMAAKHSKRFYIVTRILEEATSRSILVTLKLSTPRSGNHEKAHGKIVPGMGPMAASSNQLTVAKPGIN